MIMMAMMAMSGGLFVGEMVCKCLVGLNDSFCVCGLFAAFSVHRQSIYIYMILFIFLYFRIELKGFGKRLIIFLLL